MRTLKYHAISRSWLITVLSAFVVSFSIYYVLYFMLKVDGGYTEWSEWGKCSASCGDGLQRRMRNCTNPEPNFLGRHCVDDGSHNVEIRKCNMGLCPVDGHFSSWSAFGQCSKTCSGGVHKRTRACQNPKNGGKNCEGNSEETESCNSQIPCPVHGGFSNWSEFTKCSVMCGIGTRTRKRSCTNPAPKDGGKFCNGAVEETHPCEIRCLTTRPTDTFSTRQTKTRKPS